MLWHYTVFAVFLKNHFYYCWIREVDSHINHISKRFFAFVFAFDYLWLGPMNWLLLCSWTASPHWVSPGLCGPKPCSQKEKKVVPDPNSWSTLMWSYSQTENYYAGTCLTGSGRGFSAFHPLIKLLLEKDALGCSQAEMNSSITASKFHYQPPYYLTLKLSLI